MQILEIQVSTSHSINICRPDGSILVVNYLLGILYYSVNR